MKEQQDCVEHFGAFLESSSLLAHDISGQIHVSQFCVDELSHELRELGAETKFVDRLQESIEELSELSVLYRQFIKDQAFDNMTASFWQAHKACVRTLNLHYFKDREKLSFEVDSALQELGGPLLDFKAQKALYGLYSLCLEWLKREELEGSICQIHWVEKNKQAPGCRLLFTHEYGFFEKEKLLELSDEDIVLAGKPYRRSNSLTSFRNALQGKLETVKIVADDKYAHGLLLEFESVS